jgi:hypothetical protein
MRRILFDTNMPRGLRALLSGYAVHTADQMGWDKLVNGDLLAAAESASFDMPITADRNIRYQRNLSGRKIALIELTTSHWPTIRDNIPDVRSAVEQARAGSYTVVPLPRPAKVRRPYPPPAEP